jgi:hypothetical protein
MNEFWFICTVIYHMLFHHIDLHLYAIFRWDSLLFQVYRDSEAIPMVCCDVCEKWVHIECDGIRSV